MRTIVIMAIVLMASWAYAEEPDHYETVAVYGQNMKLRSMEMVPDCKQSSYDVKHLDEYGQVHVVKVSPCEE